MIVQDVTGQHAPYLACVNASSLTSAAHFYRSVQGVTQLDIAFLEKICNEEISIENEKCAVIKQNDTRARHCGKSYIIVY